MIHYSMYSYENSSFRIFKDYTRQLYLLKANYQVDSRQREVRLKWRDNNLAVRYIRTQEIIREAKQRNTEWYAKEVDRLGIRADTELYLNVVAGSISIFHPSNAALQLTHGLIVAFHLYTYLCVCVCIHVFVCVFDRQSDALECAWDNIRGEGSSLMVNKPTPDKFSLSPPFHILIFSRPCLPLPIHINALRNGTIFFPPVEYSPRLAQQPIFLLFDRPGLFFLAGISPLLFPYHPLSRRVFSPPESMFSLSGGDSLMLPLEFFYETYFFFSRNVRS